MGSSTGIFSSLRENRCNKKFIATLSVGYHFIAGCPRSIASFTYRVGKNSYEFVASQVLSFATFCDIHASAVERGFITGACSYGTTSVASLTLASSFSHRAFGPVAFALPFIAGGFGFKLGVKKGLAKEKKLDNMILTEVSRQNHLNPNYFDKARLFRNAQGMFPCDGLIPACFEFWRQIVVFSIDPKNDLSYPSFSSMFLLNMTISTLLCATIYGNHLNKEEDKEIIPKIKNHLSARLGLHDLNKGQSPVYSNYPGKFPGRNSRYQRNPCSY